MDWSEFLHEVLSWDKAHPVEIHFFEQLIKLTLIAGGLIGQIASQPGDLDFVGVILSFVLPSHGDMPEQQMRVEVMASFNLLLQLFESHLCLENFLKEGHEKLLLFFIHFY